MQSLRAVVLSLVVGVLAGCHSAVINATVNNRTAQPITLVQVDYPSASFGTQTIAPGGSFHYRFKVIGEGVTHLSYTDAAAKEHHADGPMLHESDDGTLSISVTPAGVQWSLQSQSRKKH